MIDNVCSLVQVASSMYDIVVVVNLLCWQISLIFKPMTYIVVVVGWSL